MEARRISCNAVARLCSRPFSRSLQSSLRKQYPLALLARKSLTRSDLLYRSYLSEFNSLDCFHKKTDAISICFFMEARRIELLSENLFTAGSPSAVCVCDSPGIKHTNKLYPSVASLFMGSSKLCRLTFTAQMTLLAQMR